MPVRFYIDADLLGLAKVLVAVRPDITYPGDPGGIGRDKRMRPPCPVVSPRTLDTDWIPTVAAEGWLIITKDTHIERRTRERQVVIDNKAKMVAITSTEKLRIWAQLEILMTQWRRIEELTALPGPFIYAVSRTARRPILTAAT